jgi:signal transduction histidine kinase
MPHSSYGGEVIVVGAETHPVAAGDLTPSRRWVVAAVIVMAGLAAAGALLWGGYLTPTRTLVVILVVILGVGWSFAGLGLLAWVVWPISFAGPLMVGVGLAWFARAIGAVDHPWISSAGLLVGSLYLAFLGHLIVTYPSGRLEARSQTVVVVALYLCTIPLNAVSLWLHRSAPCRDCAYYNLLVENRTAVAPTAGDQVLYVVIVAVTASVFVVMAQRWHAATPAGRRRSAPALWGATAILAILAIHRVSVILGVPEPVSTMFYWAVTGALMLWPVGLVVGLARAYLDRSAVADLVVEFEGPLPPGRMRGALSRALHDPSVEVAYWLPERDVFVDEAGVTVEVPSEDGGRAVTMLERDGELMAALIHDPILADQPGLVSAVAAAAALAMENERLHAQARAHLLEINASRARIVAASGAERRRVERNLHDGAQQRMLNLMLALQLARVRLQANRTDDAVQAIEGAMAELTLALTELRDLARGIHPAVLSQSGLGPAVHALAQRSTVPVRVNDDLGELRFSEPIEETAYFIVSEALANVTKHAQASQAIVGMRQLDGKVVVDITDDGVGGVRLGDGDGLRGLQDRVDAFAGLLHIDSRAGNGTRITATLPCA